MSLLKRDSARVKSRRVPHDWKVVSDYDPALDGPDERYGRMGVRCRICGEERRVAVSLAEMRLQYGCWRRGGLPYREGDLVVVPGGYLDEVQALLPDGSAVTHNLGGRTSTFRLDELRSA